MGVDLLSIGKSGLFASKKSLQTTGHNIANVNTEGFSRQSVHQTTAPPVAESGLIHGAGVRVSGIKRIHDPHIEKRMRDANSNHSMFEAKSDKLAQAEQIFNEIDSEGLNKLLSNFFNSFRDLSNNPENETIRSIVRENAKLVVKDFRRIKASLRDIGGQIGHNIKNDVAEINQLLKTIANLNRRISDLENANGETGDLRDRRDLAVKDLSRFFKLHTYADEKNQFVIQVAGVGSLVSGDSIQPLIAKGVTKNLASNNQAGAVEVFLEQRPTFPITTSFRDGAFKGMLEVRNDNVKHLMDRIDELAFNFTNSVNALHRRGFVSRGLSSDQIMNGRDNKGPITGLNFFQELKQVEDAADNMDISEFIKSDLTNMASGLSANAPGDNRLAIAISKLGHEKILADGSQTLEEHFQESIGSIAVAAGKANLDREQSQGILVQINSIKERMSGVSLDEEAANMVKFQHAYDASAKILATADEMFKSILSIMP